MNPRLVRRLHRFLACAGATAASVAFTASAPAADPTKDQCVDADTSAQALKRAGKLAAARKQLQICVSMACPALVRDDCSQRLDDLERIQPTIVFRVQDRAGHDLASVKVTLDGQPWLERLDGTAVPVDPGAHTFRFDSPGQPPLAAMYVLREAEKTRLERVILGGPAPVSPPAPAPTGPPGVPSTAPTASTRPPSVSPGPSSPPAATPPTAPGRAISAVSPTPSAPPLPPASAGTSGQPASAAFPGPSAAPATSANPVSPTTSSPLTALSQLPSAPQATAAPGAPESPPAPPPPAPSLSPASGAVWLSPPPAAAGARQGQATSDATGDKGRTMRLAGLVVGGAGVAGLVVGSVAGLSAASTWSAAKSKCGAICPAATRPAAVSEWQSASSAAVVSTVAFLAGAALAATGLVLYIAAPSNPEALRMEPSLSLGGGGVDLRGGF